jgi:hypothetical protein
MQAIIITKKDLNHHAVPTPTWFLMDLGFPSLSLDLLFPTFTSQQICAIFFGMCGPQFPLHDHASSSDSLL